MGTFTFPKIERLNKKKAIQELFDKGSSFYLYPFRVYFLQNVPELNNQVLFTVSKRNFKKAVDRNLIKRRMREAFRLNKHEIKGAANFQIAYIYTAKEILPFTQIQAKTLQSFKRFSNEEKI